MLTSPKGLPTNPRQTPLVAKQSPQTKKARRCRADRRPSRQPPAPMVLATPFFRHLARPREAEKTEREKVMMNSLQPLKKVPLLKRTVFRLLSLYPV